MTQPSKPIAVTTCGKVFKHFSRAVTPREVAQAHESITGHTIENSVRPVPQKGE